MKMYPFKLLPVDTLCVHAPNGIFSFVTNGNLIVKLISEEDLIGAIEANLLVLKPFIAP